MDITVTVWRIRNSRGLVNTVHARYPDLKRVKGEPHDIQEYTDIPCIQHRDNESRNRFIRLLGYRYIPDFDGIDAVIGQYKRQGNVNVIWNFDRTSYPQG